MVPVVISASQIKARARLTSDALASGVRIRLLVLAGPKTLVPSVSPHLDSHRRGVRPQAFANKAGN